MEREAGFVEDQASLEAIHPRIGLVFRTVRHVFGSLPMLNAKHLAGETWLYRTVAGFGAPPLFIYYEIRDDESVVMLLAANRAD